MIGTARKNENSVAVSRASPKTMPPMIVAPERDVPGISAKHCAIPTMSASFHVIASTLVTRGVPWSLYQASTAKITRAPVMSAMATGLGWNRYCLVRHRNARRRRVAGTKETKVGAEKR